MSEQNITVTEMQESDIPLIADYWLTADKTYLQNMGVDLKKMPAPEEWLSMLQSQLNKPYKEKASYCTIWQLNGKPIGHCNVNKIIFGQDAYMHLHIWNAAERKLGLGADFIKQSLPYFFNNLQLKKICCEPYALNPAPNKVLAKAGFTFIKEYSTIPGSLNFEQPVKLWQIDV